MTDKSEMTSSNLLKVFGTLFLVLLSVLMFQELLGGDIVKDARITTEGPQVLFDGEQGLWVPTSWSEYYWYVWKPYFFVAFAIVVIAVGLWHRGEQRRANDQN